MIISIFIEFHSQSPLVNLLLKPTIPPATEERNLYCIIDISLIIEIIQVYNTKLGKTEDRNRLVLQCGCTVAKGAEVIPNLLLVLNSLLVM